MEKYSLDEENKRCEKIANIIWECPFLSGLKKLSKKDLIILVERLSLKFAEKFNYCFYENCLKDRLLILEFILIETLVPNFFDKITEWRWKDEIPIKKTRF